MFEKEISSEWVFERGVWDHITNTYAKRTYENKTKIIKMKIEKNADGNNILRFIGGPTGYESYYLEDLIRNVGPARNGNGFCICGGTINSWPFVRVPMKDVFEFIDAFIVSQK